MITKRFSKFLIFTVCIILVFAVAAALLFDGATLPANDNVIADTGEGADEVSGALVSNTGYTHGSNVKNNTTAEAVNTSSAFVSAIQNNKTIRLTGSFTLSSAQVQNIWNKTYTGTIYGNGNKITVSFPTSGNGISVTSSEHKAGFGGLCGKLTGAIYDLIFEHTGGQLNVRMSGNVSGFAGGLVGSIEGGTVENVKVILSNSSGGRIGLVKEGSGSGWGSTNYYVAAGALAGRIYSGTVRNVTVVNNAWIEAGVTSGSGSTSVSTKTPGHVGNIAGIIGPVQEESWSGSIKINNIIIEGSVSSASLVGQYTANIGTLTTSTNITVNNFYNKYKNTYDSENNGSSASFAVHDCSPTLTINNRYQDSGVTTVNSTAGDRVSISGTVTVGTKYSVYFDPAATTLANSLVVVQTGVEGGDTKKAILTTNSGATYGDYAFADNGSTVIMRNLPTAISNWSNNGTFNCTINFTQDAIQVDELDPVNKWESSYTTSQSSSGTAVDNGSKLTTAIKNNQNIYLTRDITDFSGFSHTGTYSGTLDGNGHTIYIVSGAANSADTVGGLFRILSGTIKNVRIVLYSSYNRTVTSGTRGTGIVAGVINGGTVDNVYVYIPEDVTFGATGNGIEGYVGAIAGVAGVSADGKVDGANYTIKNTTVDIDGKMHLDGSYVYLAGFVGKTSTGSNAVTAEITNCVFKGNGSFASASSEGTEPIYLGGTTVLFQKETGNPQSTIKINGFINAFKGGDTDLTGGYSMYGVLSKNDNGNKMKKWTWNVSNVYDYDNPWADVNKKNVGNDYIDISDYRSTVSTTVADTSIAVTPYFPAGDTTNLVLVAGDGSSECPFVTYESYEGEQDGKYMVVSIPKAEITASSTVQLIQGKSPVNEPTLATTEEELVYKGGEITIAINQLMSGTTALGESDYTVVITENGGNALVQNGKPVNAGEYTLTVTLLNGYEFEDGMTKKILAFTVDPFVISGSLAVSGSAVYDKTEKNAVFTADENKGLFNGDNVTISYNDGDRVNVTEAGFTAMATVPNGNYTFADGNSISATLKITAKELTVVWGNTSFTYDGNEKAPTADVTEGVIDGDDVTLAVSGAVAAAGQDYIATATISPENANYTLTNDTVQFSVAKAKVSVSGADASAEYKGAAYTEEEIKAAVFASGMPDGATTTITVSPASVINAGDSATVTVELIDGDNYEFEAGAITQFTFNVTAKEISLPEASANKSAVYSPSTSYTAAQITELIFGTASIDNVTVKVMNGDVEISGDTLVSGAGVYTVTAAANENYVFVVDTVTQYTFEITKAPITLGVSVADWIYGNAANDAVITGNDGNGDVTYLYTGEGYSDSVAPQNAGTYSLEITVAETTNYQGDSATCGFTIEKATVTVPTIEDKVYTGEPLVADVSETDYYEVTKNDGGSEVATYEVVLTLKDAANYKWSDGTETAEITLEFHIVASGNSWTTPLSIVGWTYGKYSADVNAPVYKAEKGNDTAVVEVRLKTGTDADYDTVTDLSTLGAGDYYMRVRVPKTEEYGGLSAVVEFTVSKAAISVTVSIDGWTYGDVAKEPSVSGNTAGGEVTYSYEGTDDTVYAASETAPKNAGTYKVTATVAETANYLGATAEAEFTIAMKAITATVTAENTTYDGAEHAATVTFDGKVGEDELTANLLYNGEADVPVNAGSYTVTVQSYGGAAVDNYDITTKDGEVKLVISPKKLYIDDIETAAADPSDNGIYDGKEHAVKATVKYGVLYGDDVVTLKVLYNGSEDAPVNAGNYTLTFVVTDNGNYVMAEDQSKTVPVLKAKVSVKGVNATATYTGEAFGKDAIIKAVFGDADLSLVNVTVTYRQGDAAVNTGNIADIAITLKDAANYEFAAETTTTYTFTVTAGTVRLDGEDKTVEYKGEAYSEEEIKNAVFGEGNWTDFIIDISYNNAEALNAGDVATLTVAGYDDPNYTLDPETTKSFSFTVTTLKVAAPALVGDVFVYNGGAQSVSLVDDAYVAISDNSQTDKGEYIAVAALEDKANYEWASGGTDDVQLSWRISAKEISLKAETSVDKSYDGEAYNFGEYVVKGADGFYARDNVTVTVNAGETFVPGKYPLTVTYTENANYDVTVESTDAVLTIEKAALVATANPAEKEYNGSNQTFDFVLEGRIGNDEVTVGSVSYTKAGVPATPNKEGEYVAKITLSGAQADYYTVKDVLVTIKLPTMTAPDGMTADSIVLPEGELVYNGQPFVATLNFESDDGHTYGLVYYLDNNPVEEVVNAGVYTIKVYTGGKEYIIEDIEKTMTVSPAVLTADDVSLPQNTTYTYSGAEVGVSVTAKGVNNETVTLASLYDGASEKPVNAGEYAVTFVSSDSNYTVAENVGVTITILRKPFDKPSQPQLTYTGQEQTAFYDTDGYSVGGVFAATDVSVDGYTASFTLKNENYKWSGEDDSVRVVDVVWNISPATVVVTASGAETSKTYDGVALSEEELKALFTAPDKLDGTGKVAVSVTVEGGLEVLNAGEYTVIAVVSDVNYVSEEATVGYTVLKADPVVKAAVKDRLLQDGDKLSVVTVYLQEGSTAGTIAWDDPDTTLIKGDNVVTWTFVPDDGINYNGDSGKITLVVGDEVLTGLVLTQAPDKTAYNALDDFDPTGMIVTATFDDQYEQVVTDECEITVENAAEGGKISGATKRVVAEYGNMKVYVEITVTLLTVEIPALDKTETEYNASVQSVTVEENSLYEIVDGNTGVDVGTYKLKLGLTDKVNYVWSDGTSENKELSWKITPVTISGEIVLPDNLVFDGSAKEATFRLVQGTLYGDAQTGISYELPDGTKLGGAPSEAGVYEVVATLPDTVNYRFATDTEYSVSMTIKKRVISITTIGSREKVYDGIEVTEEQLAEFFSATDGIKVNVKVDGTVLDAGTYEITATIDSPNYTAEPVVCTYTVRKASKAISATLNVGYLKLDVSVNGDDTSVEYSLDGNVWAPLDGEIAVGLQEKYTVWVRYGESKNYVEGTPVKLEKNITVEALAQYVEERFEGDATLADVKDIELLERLAAAATGSDAELEARVAELSEQKETLVNGASSAVEKALKIGGRLRGYAGAAASVAVALGGIAIAAALGITVKSRKGGRKNEE